MKPIYYSNENMEYIYDLNDISKMLKVSKSTARRWVKRGILPMKQVNKRYYITHSELFDFINNKEG